MEYIVDYSIDAELQLGRLDKTITRRIMDKIDSTRSNPHRFFKRLAGRPEYKLRVGNYRIIAELIDEKHLILIRSLGHRRDIYKKFS
jgi:mRNA interferase RelE/StbE